jgi:hypothetical protein
MIDFCNSIDKIENFTTSSHLMAILVGQSDPQENPDQLHCGILFKEQEKFNAIDLAWHFFLRHSENSAEFSNFFYVKTTLHISRQYMVAAMCRLILRRHNEKKIPYGLYYSGGTFTAEGILNLKPTENGLTCATFVLAVFDSCKIKLIDIENWLPRESDLVWHDYIIKCLIKTKDRFKISDTHIDNVKNEQGCARFRPEEVAISSAFNILPSSSEQIIKYGSVLKDQIFKL